MSHKVSSWRGSQRLISMQSFAQNKNDILLGFTMHMYNDWRNWVLLNGGWVRPQSLSSTLWCIHTCSHSPPSFVSTEFCCRWCVLHWNAILRMPHSSPPPTVVHIPAWGRTTRTASPNQHVLQNKQQKQAGSFPPLSPFLNVLPVFNTSPIKATQSSTCMADAHRIEKCVRD